ncbi:hypothetical protein ACNUDN_20710 [Mycobacterium sp. smrl_JER01]|uniref:hypothetical protein n=1 Tax=Mycobacterium sp. smrl_JER01 TaxID=3402633 RepID=UPI003ACD373E
MTALALTATLLAASSTAALSIGYVLGRRAGPRKPTWRQRTSRLSLGRQAAGMLVLLAAGRLERQVRRRMTHRRVSWLIGR